MNIKHYTRFLSLGLLVALAQEGVAQTNPRAAALQEADPSGLIMTLTAVLVVFSSLLLLVVVFKLIGRLMQRMGERKKQASAPRQTEYTHAHSATAQHPSSEAMVAIALALDAERRVCTDEVAIAISMALTAYAHDQHDHESFVLTFGSRRPTQWNARSLGMRQYK